MSRQTPTPAAAIAECPHCGQKNRLPAIVMPGFKTRCGQCKTDIDESDVIGDDEDDDLDDDDEEY